MIPLRIIFMGTPEFAVASLKAIVENNFNIVAVITAPDKPAGRGQKLHESAVKHYAKSQNLLVLQPTNLKNEKFIAQLKSLEANLQVVVAFRMLPKIVWQMPHYGTFNLHASLLPNYRGAAPINWAVINGEKTTGVTTFFINEDIDTGDTILQESLSIDPIENAGELHNKLMVLGSELVLNTLKLIAQHKVNPIKQSITANTKNAYKLHRDNCKIDWNASAESIFNLIRGLSPYPGAWCQLLNGSLIDDVKIYAATIEKDMHNHENGKIIVSKNSLKVAVKNGYINIAEIKLPGKRQMPAKALLNGYKFEENSKMI